MRQNSDILILLLSNSISIRIVQIDFSGTPALLWAKNIGDPVADDRIRITSCESCLTS